MLPLFNDTNDILEENQNDFFLHCMKRMWAKKAMEFGFNFEGGNFCSILYWNKDIKLKLTTNQIEVAASI